MRELVNGSPPPPPVNSEAIAVGTPEETATAPESYNGQFLRPLLERRAVVAA